MAAVAGLAVAGCTAAAGPAEVAAQVRAVEAQIRDGNLRPAELPSAWAVETPNGRYSISTAPVRLQASQGDAEAWLENVARQLEAWQSAPPGAAGAADRIERILERPEFSSVHAPSALEILRRRIANWIRALLRRIFDVAGQFPGAATVLFWIVILGAVGMMAFALIRFWSGDVRLFRADSSGQFAKPLTRSSQEWLRAARAAQDPREAIHCAYWAGIAALQESELLPLDSARTPREYLRAAPRAAAGPLRVLTSALERFWYAGKPARMEDARESLDQLEALGCK